MDTLGKKRTLHKFVIENFYQDKTLKKKREPLTFEEKYTDGFVIINRPPQCSYNSLLITLISLHNDLR